MNTFKKCLFIICNRTCTYIKTFSFQWLVKRVHLNTEYLLQKYTFTDCLDFHICIFLWILTSTQLEIKKFYNQYCWTVNLFFPFHITCLCANIILLEHFMFHHLFLSKFFDSFLSHSKIFPLYKNVVMVYERLLISGQCSALTAFEQ